MKPSYILILIVMPLALKAQSIWGGYGLQGGLQGCGYDVSMGDEAQSYKDDIKELQQQISTMQKDKAKKKEQLRKVQAELRKHDGKLRITFSSDAYSFIKSHFDEENRCQDYRGFGSAENSGQARSVQGTTTESPSAEIATSPAPEKPTPAPIKPALPTSGNQKPAPANVRDIRPVRGSSLFSTSSRSPASSDDEDEERDRLKDIKIDIKKLNADWPQLCDLENNPRAQLRAAICSKKYLWISENPKPNISDCQAAVLNYPKAKGQEDALKREVEALDEAIKVARESIKDNQTSMREAVTEARQQRIEEIREGGICISCLAGGSDISYQSREPNIGGVVTNSLMALLAYNSSKNFYGTIADKNASIGFPTQMPMGSPFMAATPYVLGAIGAGLGAGGFGCAGLSGGIAGLGGAYGPYAALGGLGQIGGAFGTPPWALGGALGGGAYLNGMTPWGANGPWGLNNLGLGMYPQLMAGGQLGLSLPGLNGMAGAGALTGLDPYSLAALNGMGGIPGLGAAGGIGGSLMNPYAALGGFPYGAVGGLGAGALGGGLLGGGLNGGIPGIMGIGGMGGLGGLGGLPYGGALGGGLGGLGGMGGLGALGGGNLQMQQQMMQMQLQQQQQAMQQQMRYYENYMQRQQAMAGLQTELMGLLQRYQQVQYGVGASGSYLGTGTSLGLGNVGGFGGLPSGTFGGGATPAPLNNRR